jgi:glycosyltransferase involved in cell wall biosynthesis
MPQIDILLPVYNPEPSLLKEALKSIIEQSFSDWILWVIQDGGTTDISSTLNEVNDRRINFKRIPHGGKAAALNYGIRQGTGKYIAYLDDDDVWYPNHLQVVVATMTNNNYRFVYTDAEEVFLSKDGNSYNEIRRQMLGKGILTEKLLWYISHINVAHERSLIDQGGLYNEQLQFFIDWDMFLRMAKIAKPYHVKVITCRHNMYDQRQNKDGTISQVHKKDPELSRKAFADMIKRAFELISPSDFVDITLELKQKEEFHRGFKENTHGKLGSTERNIPSEQELLRELENLYGKHQQLLSYVDILTHSMSWKITKPLRWFYHSVLKR